MGTPEFAVPSLQKIHQSSHQIVGVVTQPDRPRGRGQKVLPSPVKQFALEHHLHPILQPEKLKEEKFLQALRELNADVFVVVAFRILPEEVFTMPVLGTVNLHPSLLPRYRGAAPINWAIIEGEKVTGVTTIFIRKEIDAGSIILQKEVPIGEDDTAGTLHDRLAAEGADLLLETLNLIAAGEVKTTRQDEGLVTRAPKLTREIAHLNFNQPAPKVKQWIHGLSPYPGAYAYYQGKMVKFYRAEVISTEKVTAPPGTIVKAEKDQLWIACNPGIIAILELQMQGKKRLGVAEFLRGNQMTVTERFQ